MWCCPVLGVVLTCLSEENAGFQFGVSVVLLLCPRCSADHFRMAAAEPLILLLLDKEVYPELKGVWVGQGHPEPAGHMRHQDTPRMIRRLHPILLPRQHQQVRSEVELLRSVSVQPNPGGPRGDQE